MKRQRRQFDAVNSQWKSQEEISFSAAPEMVAMTIKVPAKFKELCEKYYHLKPARVAAALIYTFTKRPPTQLILAARATDKTGGPEA